MILLGRERIKLSVLKAPHLQSIIETQRVLCCKKLASDQPSSWKIILLHYLKLVGRKLVLCCNFELQKLASLCISKKLAEKGIIRIGDLISDNNELIIRNNRRSRELNISPLDAFRLLTLIDALPLEWREGLKEEEPFNIYDEIKLNLNEQTVLSKTAASKTVYKEL